MSIKLTADTDWLRSGFNGIRSNAFTAGGYVNLVTDDNAIRPVLVLYDGSSAWYGIYTNTDGTNLRISTPAGGSASGNLINMSTGTWYGIAIRGWINSGTDTISIFTPGQARIDIAFANMNIQQVLYGSDFINPHLSAKFAYPWCVNYAASDSDINTFLNSTTPLAGVDSSGILYTASLGGSDITTALASASVANQCYGFGMSNTTGVWDASMPTFGPSASGSCVLPIA